MFCCRAFTIVNLGSSSWQHSYFMPGASGLLGGCACGTPPSLWTMHCGCCAVFAVLQVQAAGTTMAAIFIFSMLDLLFA
jgi:hypothetical protein